MKAFFIYCRNRRNFVVWIFAFAFLTYFFLGFWNSYSQAFTKCTYFGSDNERVYGDLTNIVYNHYRIKVHPLFLLAAQTITVFLNKIINDPIMAVIIEEAFCGAMSVGVVYLILKTKNIEKHLCIFFTLIYAASFSMMIFSAVPETFIFAGLDLLSYWFFITVALKSKDPLSGTEFLLLIFFGVICFGITFTNFLSYIIGLIVLLSCRYDVKTAVKEFFLINIMNSIAIIVLCLFQRYIWEDCPLFWTSIIGWMHGEGYEETMYMDWQFTISKTVVWLKNIFLYPLFSPNVYAIKMNEKLVCILFGSYSNFMIKLLLIIFYTVSFTAILKKMLTISKLSEKNERKYILGLLAAFGSNAVLHYIYGYMEAFIYTPHFFFLFILLTALSLQDIKNTKYQYLLKSGFFFFLIVEFVNNFLRFHNMTRVASRLAETDHYPRLSVKVILLMGGGLAFSVYYVYSKWKRVRVETPKDKPNGKMDGLCRFVIAYIVIVFTSGLYIVFWKG